MGAALRLQKRALKVLIAKGWVGAMLELEYQGRITASNDSFDTAISDLMVVRDVLVSVSRDGGGLASWAIDGSGLPVLTQMRTADTGSVTGEGPQLARYEGASIDGVIVAGFGTGVLDVSPVNGSQTIGSPQDRSAGGDAWAHVLQIRDDLLVVAEAGGDGLRLFRDSGGTSFAQVRNVRDTDESYADSISAMASARIEGRDFLFVGSATERGLTSYEITGTQASIRGLHGPEDGLGLMVPTALEVVRLADQSYLLVASMPGVNGASGALSVMAIGPGGGLTPRDHVLDTLQSRFGQVQSLATLEYGEMALVAAGGGDDGLSLLALSAAGQLVHLDAFADTVAAGLSDITALEMSLQGETLRIYATSEETRGITVLTVDLSEFGVLRTANTGSTQGGSAGDDILIDGPGDEMLNGQGGADLFVVGSDGVQDRIQNFDPNTDLIDLSSWAFLYDPAALSISSTARGARIFWRGESLDIRAQDEQPLDPEVLRASIRVDINRSFTPPSVASRGTDADERLAGSWGNDSLHGGGGADTLEGGAGDDTLNGGSGTDQVILNSRASDIEQLQIAGKNVTLWTGEGEDRIARVETFVFEDVTLSRKELARYAPPTQTQGTAGKDRLEDTFRPAELKGLEGRDTLISGQFDDTLKGGKGHDRLTAGAGDDLLDGGKGNDLLTAGSGDDTLRPGTGNDTLEGGSGLDEVILTMSSQAAQVTAYENGRITLVTADGILEIAGVEWFTFSDQTLSLAEMEDRVGPLEIAGSAGSDTLEAPGDMDTRLTGGAGDDALTGLGGNDILSGGDGLDTLRAGRGDDTLDGGSGKDNILGERGNDEIRGNSGDDTLKGGNGTDLIYGDRNDDVLRGEKGADTLYGGTGNDNISGGGGQDRQYGEAGNDLIKGGGHSDTLKGGSGNDTLSGNGFADTLAGGAGQDVLRGGKDADHLTGGTGDDVLKGGRGADVFLFERGHDRDVIRDFDPMQDILHLSEELTNGRTNPGTITNRFARETDDGVLFSFGDGDTILLEGLILADLQITIETF